MVVVGVIVLALVSAPMILTAVGARRRGDRLALVAGLFFPVAWAIWYVRDGDSPHHAEADRPT
ncbi:hypothetical protein [Nocardioides sp. Iso805N]|uniref:hypothetical protein n=1 Tax=Nocardioides sp. Iso805N TaxID=1283287 RepID=UPI0003824112|nr:hypothetical protein [Nocardioides sp. Iso805N]